MHGMVTHEGKRAFKSKPFIAFGTRITDKPVLENQKQLQNALGSIDRLKAEYSP